MILEEGGQMKFIFEGVAHDESWDLFDGLGIESFDGLNMIIAQFDGCKQFVDKTIRVTIEELSQTTQDGVK